MSARDCIHCDGTGTYARNVIDWGERRDTCDACNGTGVGVMRQTAPTPATALECRECSGTTGTIWKVCDEWSLHRDHNDCITALQREHKALRLELDHLIVDLTTLTTNSYAAEMAQHILNAHHVRMKK